MRTIKFRGKRTNNGEWMYGFCCSIQNKENYILIPCALGVEWIEVNPNTIGQFTGLYDKNGNEIYEGDILSMDCFSTETGKYTKNMVVIYKTEDANDGTQWSEFTLTDIVDNRESAFLKSKRMAIIGNIHDNPNLLK